MIQQAQDTNWVLLISGLFGGLALFLYGLDKMGNALRYLSGYRLKKIITKLATHRICGLFTGIMLTAMMQSSSATTVLLVGFVSAEMLTLAQALGVILGADIGTTLTVQLIAFKITKYALVPLALGFFIKTFSKEDSWENLGRSLLGFGMLFYGIELMSLSMSPLRSHEMFISIMSEMNNPLLGIIFGAIFTALIQSSAASLAIVIALANQQLIGIEAGIGLMLGANIGTCITAILACIGKNKAAQRTATAHVLFKVSSVILIFPFLEEFQNFVQALYPFEADTKLLHSTAGIIANSHLVFNIMVAIVFLPLTTQVAKLLTKLLPEKKSSTMMQTKYLDPDMLDTPAVALTSARREIYRMGIYVEKMLEKSFSAVTNKDRKLLADIHKSDEFIDFLYKEITSYLIKISKAELATQQSQDLIILSKIASDLETIGDLLEKNLVDLGKKFVNERTNVPSETLEDAEKAFNLIRQTFTLTLISINHPNQDVLKEVENKKSYLKRLTNKINNDKLELPKESAELLKIHSIYEDLVEVFARIFYYSRKIAKNLQKQENTDEQETE